MDLHAARVVVTGAASGIGRGILEELGRLPLSVVASDVDGARLEDAVRALGPDTPARVTTHPCDVSRPDQLDGLLETSAQRMGGVNLFFANAGFAYYERMGEPDWDRLERIYRVNVLAPLYVARKMAVLNTGRPYRVVVTASAMGLLALPGYAVYGSTKAALHHFAQAYRHELPDPASLTLVYPIGTRTGFFRAAGPRAAPEPWPTQTTQHVVRCILAGVRRDAHTILPSTLFRAVLWANRFLPAVGMLVQALEKRRFRRWLAQGSAQDAP
jgi:short-subunit dehydrogenase